MQALSLTSWLSTEFKDITSALLVGHAVTDRLQQGLQVSVQGRFPKIQNSSDSLYNRAPVVVVQLHMLQTLLGLSNNARHSPLKRFSVIPPLLCCVYVGRAFIIWRGQHGDDGYHDGLDLNNDRDQTGASQCSCTSDIQSM